MCYLTSLKLTHEYRELHKYNNAPFSHYRDIETPFSHYRDMETPCSHYRDMEIPNGTTFHQNG